MKIIINPKNLIIDDSWKKFRKVRAIIENQNGCFAITNESGKYIFPGGKCDKMEDNLSAIQREVKEETGIDFSKDDFREVLQIESFYDDILDFRTNIVGPRHTVTTYYYVKTNQTIDFEKQNLTNYEKLENFRIFFVDKETLFKMLEEKHTDAPNWYMFYEENQIIVNNILKSEII